MPRLEGPPDEPGAPVPDPPVPVLPPPAGVCFGVVVVAQDGGERLTAQQFHHEKSRAVRFLAVVQNTDGVRMSYAIGGVTFGQEASAHARVIREARVQHFDGDTPTVAVDGLVDRPRAANP